MSFTIRFPPFSADSRGNKLKSHDVRDHKGVPDSLLMLCGPEEVIAQIVAVAGGTCVERSLSDKGRERWTHALYFQNGVSAEIADLCEDLAELLSIPNSASIDLSLSLDWYKQADDEGELVHTPAGQLIYRTKYANNPTWSSSRQARRELLKAMATTIENHPILASAELISTPPGSKGDGTSFGEILGQDVAKQTGRRFMPMTGPARAPQKEEIGRKARDDFELSEVVREPILLIDDVFHTGVTLESAARAARRAGASEVFALTAARTLRK